jgi:hypothetical protein
MSSMPPPGAEAAPENPAAEAPAPPVPQDTDDTRSVHFKRFIRHPVTLSLGATVAISALIAGALGAGIAIGAAAAGAAVVLTVLIVFMIANAKAKHDFYSAYAEGRSLSRIDKGGLAPGTPFLRRGDDRYAHHIMRGTLPGGVDGTVALYTYEETDTDSEGDRQTTYYHFTVVLADIPESARHVGELYAQRRVGFRFLDSAEDVFRTRERITLESEALDQRAEIFAAPGEDQNWLRQLFSPTFVHWLGDEAPDGTAFELVAGLLCVNVRGHLDNAADLDQICESAAVIATRIREESREAKVGEAPPPVSG